MLPKHNSKKTPKNETVCEWGRHWNNDDEIPGKMYIDWSRQKKRKGEKKLEEESSRFTAAGPTERQWRWVRKWERKIAMFRLEARCGDLKMVTRGIRFEEVES